MGDRLGRRLRAVRRRAATSGGIDTPTPVADKPVADTGPGSCSQAGCSQAGCSQAGCSQAGCFQAGGEAEGRRLAGQQAGPRRQVRVHRQERQMWDLQGRQRVPEHQGPGPVLRCPAHHREHRRRTAVHVLGQPEGLRREGREFSADSEAAMYDDSSQVLWEEINPGNSVKGKAYFDVPKGAKLTQLELHDSMFSDGVQGRPLIPQKSPTLTPMAPGSSRSGGRWQGQGLPRRDNAHAATRPAARRGTEGRDLSEATPDFLTRRPRPSARSVRTRSPGRLCPIGASRCPDALGPGASRRSSRRR